MSSRQKVLDLFVFRSHFAHTHECIIVRFANPFISFLFARSPPAVDTTVAFPHMSDCEVDDDLVNHPQQPTIDKEGMWIWPGPDGYKKKPVIGNFAVNLVTVDETNNDSASVVNVSSGASVSATFVSIAILVSIACSL